MALEKKKDHSLVTLKLHQEVNSSLHPCWLSQLPIGQNQCPNLTKPRLWCSKAMIYEVRFSSQLFKNAINFHVIWFTKHFFDGQYLSPTHRCSSPLYFEWYHQLSGTTHECVISRPHPDPELLICTLLPQYYDEPSCMHTQVVTGPGKILHCISLPSPPHS